MVQCLVFIKMLDEHRKLDYFTKFGSGNQVERYKTKGKQLFHCTKGKGKKYDFKQSFLFFMLQINNGAPLMPHY